MRKNIKIIMAIMVAATLFTVNNATVKANIDENNATSNDAAVKKVIEYLFNIVKLDFIVCGHFLNNDRSRRVQEKCGFVHYKIFKYETSYGKIVDSWTSILLNNQNK